MPATTQARAPATSAVCELRARRLDALYDAERAFVHLYGASQNAFWLDSAMGGPYGRFSFIGDASGPHGAVVTYDVDAGEVRVERGGEVEVLRESIFDYLRRESGRRRHLGDGLPFGFDCGFAGYLGYELKADCDGDAAHESPLPDAALVFADRLIAFDHRERRTWLLCLAGPEAAAEAERWLEETSLRLASLPPLREQRHTGAGECLPLPPEPESAAASNGPHNRRISGSSVGLLGSPTAALPELRLRCSRERYLDDIAACKRRLRAGETYEVCLTNKVVAEAPVEPLELYRRLRRANPAPFGAFLRFGDVAVLSSSPERFLRAGRDGWAESRPIKGTCRRGATPAEDARLAAELAADPKSRAENVTIVDLVRNDLGIVCEPGSVHVPDLMRVESYETVHQLVSTVRGRLRDGLGPVDCVRACFPPGSMTGAPKRRTMEIIDELEGEARGPYSGVIGWLGLGGGCDLSVAIRTIVLDGESAAIGAGGAIVLDSDPEREHEEMLLKAVAPLRAIARPPAVEPTSP